MQNIKSQVFAALDEIAPNRAYFVVPDDDAKLPCISYLELNNTPVSFADDEEAISRIEIGVDIWADAQEDISPLMLAVDEKMTEMDGKRVYATDIPPDETHVFHKHMRYAFMEGS